jgi:hypothetical protein
MPNQANGRSNYRVDPNGVEVARGYGTGRYSRVRVLWDSTRAGDRTCADVPFDESPISHDQLDSIILGLNNGSIEDRWI